MDCNCPYDRTNENYIKLEETWPKKNTIFVLVAEK